MTETDERPARQPRTGTKTLFAVKAERQLVDDVHTLRRLHGRKGISFSAYVLLAVGRQVRADKALFGVDTREATDDG